MFSLERSFASWKKKLNSGRTFKTRRWGGGWRKEWRIKKRIEERMEGKNGREEWSV